MTLDLFQEMRRGKVKLSDVIMAKNLRKLNNINHKIIKDRSDILEN